MEVDRLEPSYRKMERGKLDRVFCSHPHGKPGRLMSVLVTVSLSLSTFLCVAHHHHKADHGSATGLLDIWSTEGVVWDFEGE